MIKIQNISKSFDKQILRDFSLEIPNNGLIKISGPSGSGKSTLLKCISGIENVDSGVIEIDGERIIDSSSVIGKKLIFLNTNGILIRSLNFDKNLKALPFNVNKGKLASLINFFDAQPLINKKLVDLSEGEFKTLNIIYTLSCDYSYYIFDEPFSGLDQNRKKILEKLLIDLSKNKAVILIDHECNLNDERYNVIVKLPSQNIKNFAKFNDIDTKETIKQAENQKVSKFEFIKQIFSKNKLAYIFDSILLILSTIFLCLGTAFLPQNEAKLTDKIIQSDPYTYQQSGYLRNNEILDYNEISKSNNFKDSFFAINPIESYFFMPINEGKFSFDTEYESNLVFIVDNKVEENTIYYEKDFYYYNKTPLLDLAKINNSKNLNFVLLQESYQEKCKSNKFYPYEIFESSRVQNLKRTDYLHFSKASLITFINNNIVNQLITPEGKQILKNTDINLLKTSNKKYKVTIAAQDNIFEVGDKNKGENLDFFTNLSPFTLTTTASNQSLKDDELIISYNYFLEYLKASPAEIKLFVNKNNKAFLDEFSLSITSSILKNYENQEQFLYYSIAFYSIGSLFLTIFIINFIMSHKKIAKSESDTQSLKLLGLNSKEIGLIKYSHVVIISIVSILFGIMAISIAFPFEQILAYKIAFTNFTNPLYIAPGLNYSLYSSLSLIYIRGYSYLGILVGIIPSLITITINHLINIKYENRS